MIDVVPAIGSRRPLLAHNIVLAIIISLLLGPAALTAIALGFGSVPLPYQLFLVRERLPVAFPVHMVASGLALILIPIAAVLRHWRGVHLALGRSAAVCVVTGGTPALLVALASEATFAARAGLFTQGLVWLALVAAAVVAIRTGNMLRHARLMIAMAAVASGAIWLRLVLYGAVSAELPFDTVYAVAAWGCWIIPLGLAVIASRGLHRSTERPADQV